MDLWGGELARAIKAGIQAVSPTLGRYVSYGGQLRAAGDFKVQPAGVEPYGDEDAIVDSGVGMMVVEMADVVICLTPAVNDYLASTTPGVSLQPYIVAARDAAVAGGWLDPEVAAFGDIDATEHAETVILTGGFTLAARRFEGFDVARRP